MEKRNPKMIRLIRQLIKDMGLTEPEYRAAYESATGKSEMHLMDDKDLARVITYLKGAQGKSATGTYRGVTLCRLPHARKIRSLWLELKDLGALRNSSEQTLLAYVEKLTGKNDMADLNRDQINEVIETLKKWVARVEAVQLERLEPETAGAV